MKAATIVLLTCVLSVSCAGLLSWQPTSSDKAQLAQTAARIADGIQFFEVALDATGQTLDQLPLSVAQKDSFDCGILALNGHDAPSVTVLKVCGAIPPTSEAPVGKALAALRGVVSRPGLCGTVNTFLTAVKPFLDRLQAAGVPVATLQTALSFTLRFAGGCV